MNLHEKVLAALAVTVALAAPASAAVGCTLSNPAADLKYLYPEMTSYREELREMPKLKDGKALYEKLRARVGDLDPVYEAFDTPYTLYSVFKDTTRIGYVHGVNVPGKGGVIQVFVAADPETAAVRTLFFQRIESPASKALRDKAFRARFTGLTVADFYRHDYYAVAAPTSTADKLAPALTVPSGLPPDGEADVRAALRGIRKNLILLDIFAYDMRHEPFYEKAQSALAAHKAAPASTPQTAKP